MRYRQAEKMEIIRLVEGSPVSVRQTLSELNINRSTFYNWYKRYEQGGPDALEDQYRPPEQFWNEIPPWEKTRVVETALEHPEKSPRELAWHITDKRGYYISESTVYRILKAHDLVTSPVYTVVSARNPRPFVETELSFSTYGARDERIAVVVKNKHTGEVIREIPSEEMQKLHVHLDMLI